MNAQSCPRVKSNLTGAQQQFSLDAFPYTTEDLFGCKRESNLGSPRGSPAPWSLSHSCCVKALQ